MVSGFIEDSGLTLGSVVVDCDDSAVWEKTHKHPQLPETFDFVTACSTQSTDCS